MTRWTWAGLVVGLIVGGLLLRWTSDFSWTTVGIICGIVAVARPLLHWLYARGSRPSTTA